MLMQFHMAPGSCSTGIHILLQELDLLFEVRLVNLPRGDHHSAEYRALNPKGTIPVLVLEDGTALTEFQAIAWWLAASHPQAGLLPADPLAQARVLEMMDYVVGTLHMQAFARLFTTERFAQHPDDHDAVKQQGREQVAEAFAVIDGQLHDSGYVLAQYSIADAALFYVEFWAMHLGLPLPARCEQHYRQMLQRPAVAQILMEEGYASHLQRAAS